MNPIFKTIQWPKANNNPKRKRGTPLEKNPSLTHRVTTSTAFALDRFGAAHIVATLRERRSGEIISRSMQSVTVTREQVEPIKLTLQQPFVSTETTLPAEVRLNIQEEKLLGATVVATLTNDSLTKHAGEPLHSTKKEATKAPLQLLFPIKGLSPGRYEILINVAGKSGQSLAKSERSITRYIAPGKPRTVSIDKRGVCLVDGKPMMPLGFMHGGNSGRNAGGCAENRRRSLESLAARWSCVITGQQSLRKSAAIIDFDPRPVQDDHLSHE